MNSSIGKIEEIIEQSPDKNILKIKLGDKKYKSMIDMPSLVSFCRRGAPNIAVLEQRLIDLSDYISKKVQVTNVFLIFTLEESNLTKIKSGDQLVDENKDITEESEK